MSYLGSLEEWCPPLHGLVIVSYFLQPLWFFLFPAEGAAPLYPPVVTDKLGWFLCEKGTGYGE